ncbi:MAG: hypothetical protein ACRDJH_07375 [Thermomicrobiales bacterium]
MTAPIEKHGVAFAGENPMIVLYQQRPGGDECVAIASLWRSAYSAAGEGHALVIWVDPVASGFGDLAPIGIYTDNLDLARLVWTNFYQDYDLIHNRGIDDSPPHTARFVYQADGRRLHRFACSTGTTTIELEWRDAQEPFQSITYLTGYEVSVVACPCPRASIAVNGQIVPGEVRLPHGVFKSSAILAFAETWIER